MAVTTTNKHTAADEELRLETEAAQATGVTSPMGWARIGLVVLLALVAIVLVMQMMGGNKGTDVIPGTPIAAPQNNVPVPAA